MSGASTAFPFAVTVTAPVLVVEPDAIVSVLAVLRSKSAPTAPVPAAASTVTVTAALDTPDSVAVTVVTPPVSEIDVDDSASATVGNASSSVSVSAAPVTAMVVPSAVARAFATVAVTVVERPAVPWCTSSFTAVTVTVSVAFAVSPAAMTMVVSEPTVVKPVTAPTVTVVRRARRCDSVAVTVDSPPFSEIDDGDNDSVTPGAASSSVVVTDTSTFARPL